MTGYLGRHIDFAQAAMIGRGGGARSRCPELWRGLAAMWLPGYDGINSHDLLGRYHLTAYNTPTRAIGAMGPCMLFDDAESQYQVSATTLSVTYPVTMICWFACDDVAGNNAGTPFSLAGSGATNHYYRIAVTSGNDLYFYARDAGDQAACSISNVIYDDVWVHTAYVGVDKTHHAGFCNGTQKTTSATDVTPVINRAGVGSLVRSVPTSYPFSGRVAVARVYNRACTDAAVAYDYERGWWEMLTPRPAMESMYVPSGEEPAFAGRTDRHTLCGLGV